MWDIWKCNPIISTLWDTNAKLCLDVASLLPTISQSVLLPISTCLKPLLDLSWSQTELLARANCHITVTSTVSARFILSINLTVMIWHRVFFLQNINPDGLPCKLAKHMVILLCIFLSVHFKSKALFVLFIEFESIVSGAFGDESIHYITIVLFPFISAMILKRFLTQMCYICVEGS